MKHRFTEFATAAALAALAVACLLCAPVSNLAAAESAAADATQPAVVPYIKILSDKIEDVSSIEAWQASFIKPGMTDAEKALAVWTTVVKFRHQAPPPNEFIQSEGNVHDPIKTFNVYGYGMCCCASSNIECLSRFIGLVARGRAIHSHSVPEIQYDGAWHLFDASLITYFPNAENKVASVDEIIASITDWYAANPGYKDDQKKLYAFMRGEGWRKGPAVLAGSKFYSTNGWLPAATHGWYTTMMEYDGNPKYEYEYGYSQGYRVNVALRDGEVLTRNWSNQGLHVNMKEDKELGLCKTQIGTEDMKYATQYGDIAPGRIGNGSLVYTVPVGSPALKNAALVYDNLTASGLAAQPPTLQAAQAPKPGVLVLRMPSSYVYLAGVLTGKATVAAGGTLKIAASRNNGQDWQEIYANSAPGAVDLSVDLAPVIFRRYDYQLKFELTGGVTITALKIDTTIQNSQRSLPALGQGKNTITFSAGNPGPLAPTTTAATTATTTKATPPQFEGTVTVEATAKQAPEGGQVSTADFHGTAQNLTADGYGSHVAGPTGSLTFPIQTPGAITHVRFGCHYRAMDPKDKWELQLSFDAGKTWTTAGTCEGGYRGHCKYVSFDTPPAGAKSVQVRYLGTQVSETILFSYRIDVDYVEPHGGFRPVQVTYVWDEDGQEKRDVHIAKTPFEAYTIDCAKKPALKSLIVELAK